MQFPINHVAVYAGLTLEQSDYQSNKVHIVSHLQVCDQCE